MITETEHFLDEPRDDAYRALVRAMAKLSDTFLLVVVRAKSKKPRRPPVVLMLEPWLLRSDTRDRWPGGGVGGRDIAELYYFRASADAVEILANEATGLFEWRQVNGPQDLTFFDTGGRVVLGTIAHETHRLD